MAEREPTQQHLFPQGDAPEAPAGGATADIRDSYLRGEPTRKIALRLGISRKEVLQVLREGGVILQSERARKANSFQKRAQGKEKLREERRAAGLCVFCGKPNAAGSASMCDRHLEVSRRRRQSRKSNGKCNGCGKAPLPGRANCQNCLNKVRERHEHMSAQRKEAGVCQLCGKAPPDPTARPWRRDRVGLGLCVSCRDRGRTHLRKTRAGRQEAGLCVDCGKAPQPPDAACCRPCFFRRASAGHFGTVAEAGALAALWDAQGGRCPYTGWTLTPGKDAALDHRIAVTRGGSHDLSNLQWVHKDVNQMKWNFTEEELFRLVAAVYLARVAPG